ncbi:hypothetical protein DHC50_16050 [Arenibacter sp. A80]|nr:hypothetical protein [Arenibacter sp. A80]RFT55510.1 hypothetical protein D0S24_16045 [Arenibacter sp. P308M17]
MGTFSYKKNLAQWDRANRCTELGLAVRRIGWNRYGAAQPMGNNGDEEGRAPNGSVGFIISKPLEK